jgi:hypothetical protein
LRGEKRTGAKCAGRKTRHIHSHGREGKVSDPLDSVEAGGSGLDGCKPHLTFSSWFREPVGNTVLRFGITSDETVEHLEGYRVRGTVLYPIRSAESEPRLLELRKGPRVAGVGLTGLSHSTLTHTHRLYCSRVCSPSVPGEGWCLYSMSHAEILLFDVGLAVW